VNIGLLRNITNAEHKNSEKYLYNKILVTSASGEMRTLLITEAELLRILERSSRNAEDIIVPSFFDRMYARLIKLKCLLFQ
jgi:hypothetical protein